MSYAVITGRTTNPDGSTSWDAIAGTQGGTYNLREQGATTLLDSTTVPAASAPVTLTDLAINGPLSINEGSTGQYTVTATYSDGSTQPITTGITWSANAPNGLVSIPSNNVPNDSTLIAVTAAYDSRNASKNVSVIDTTAAPDADYQAYATKSQEQDASILTANKWWIKYLKDNGLWADLLLAYMNTGTTQLSHSVNVRNVNAYQMTFPNGAGFTAAGIQWNPAAQTYGVTGFPFSAIQVDNYSLFFNTGSDTGQGTQAEFGGQYTTSDGTTNNFDLLADVDGQLGFESRYAAFRALPTAGNPAVSTRKGLSGITNAPATGPTDANHITVYKNGMQLGAVGDGDQGNALPAYTAGELLAGCRMPGILHSDGLMAGFYLYERYFTPTEVGVFTTGLQQYNAMLGRPSF
ncbi:MAG: hypothetical protein ACRYFZ_09480 [Janthinobacterium lividum]